MVPRLPTPGVFALLLIVVTGLLYAPSIGYPAVYEDKNDPGRFEWSGLSNLTTNPLRTVNELSFELARGLSGRDVWGDHLVSVALHVVNVALVGAVAWLLLPPWGAVFAMGLFAWHPVQVEAVAYISGRADLLAACGLLLALLAALRGSLTGACVGLLLAALSKEAAVMAGPLVCLWAWQMAPAFPVKKLLWLLGTVGALVVLAFWFRMRLALPDLEHVGRTAWSVVRLTGLVFLPFGQSIDHDWHGAGLLLRALSIWLVVALSIWAGLRLTVERSYVALAWLTTLGWCLPRFLVAAPEGLHEHHMVVPMVGWALCAGAFVSRQSARAERYSDGDN